MQVRGDAQLDRESNETSAGLLATADRVMACIDDAAAPDVLYTAARLSSELHSVCYAVYVAEPRQLDDPDPLRWRGSLSDNLALAELLGAVVVRVAADDHVDGLIEFARREGVTHVVFGDGRSPVPHRTRSIAARLKAEMHGAALVAVPLVAAAAG